VLVVGHKRVDCKPLESSFRLAQQHIQKVTEHLLHKHGYEHAEPNLLLARKAEPRNRRQEEAEQPEERTGDQYDDANGIVHDGHDEHGQRRAESRQRATGELQKRHRGRQVVRPQVSFWPRTDNENGENKKTVNTERRHRRACFNF